MDSALSLIGLPLSHFGLAGAFALLAGFVKGAIGFAMPMIMISGLASFLSPELALAGLILPTVATNFLQAIRDGIAAAWSTTKKYRLYLGVGAVCIISSAQLVRSIDERALYAMIGLPMIVFGVLQLLGYKPTVVGRHRLAAETVLGAISGIVGGISGVWGPPLVLYLTATDTPKGEQVRVLGVAFGLGAVLLLIVHLQTGVLNARTLPFSAALLAPALVGLWAGQRLHDSMDQRSFRHLTLIVLILAGLNLLRRALV